MQRPPKKRSPREMAARAYDLFRRAERSRRVLTEDAICRYTSYTLGTLRGHISKKYRWFLHGDRSTGYTVNGLGQITKAKFIEMHRQTIKEPPIVIERVVERHYTLAGNSVEMWIIVAALIVVGIWWK